MKVPEDQSTSSTGTAKASAVMAAGTLISRVLGFARTALLAIAIGNTALVADVFESANTIPNVIYMLLAGGVFNVVLVPQLIKAAKAADRGADYTSRLITLAMLVIGAFTVAITLCAYPIMSALTLGWSEPKLALATAFAFWTLPQIFFYGMYAVIGQVLNAHGRFGAYMWAPVANNVVAIAVIGIYLVMFGHYQGMDGTAQLAQWTPTHTLVLAGGHTLGIIVQAVVLFWPLKRLGLGLKLKFGWRGMGLKTTGQLAGFTIITMLVGNLSNLLINRQVTGATEARSEVGLSAEHAASIPGLAALNVSQLVTVLPHSVFVLSIATVLFNQLTRALQDGDVAMARILTRRGLSIFAIPMVFFMVLVIVLAGPIGRLFAGPADNAYYAASAIGQILVLLALGMPFRSAHFYLLRVFYASENARVPMVVQVSAALFTLVIVWTMTPLVPADTLAHMVALSITVTHVLQFIATDLMVRRHFGHYGLIGVITTYVRTGYAAIFAGLVGSLIAYPLGGFDKDGFAYASITNALATCCLVGIAMVVTFVIAAKVFRLREFDEFLRPLLRRFTKRA